MPKPSNKNPRTKANRPDFYDRLRSYRWTSIEFGKLPVVYCHRVEGDGVHERRAVCLTFADKWELKELVSTLKGFLNAMDREGERR